MIRFLPATVTLDTAYTLAWLDRQADELAKALNIQREKNVKPDYIIGIDLASGPDRSAYYHHPVD